MGLLSELSLSLKEEQLRGKEGGLPSFTTQDQVSLQEERERTEEGSATELGQGRPVGTEVMEECMEGHRREEETRELVELRLSSPPCLAFRFPSPGGEMLSSVADTSPILHSFSRSYSPRRTLPLPATHSTSSTLLAPFAYLRPQFASSLINLRSSSIRYHTLSRLNSTRLPARYSSH